MRYRRSCSCRGISVSTSHPRQNLARQNGSRDEDLGGPRGSILRRQAPTSSGGKLAAVRWASSLGDPRRFLHGQGGLLVRRGRRVVRRGGPTPTPRRGSALREGWSARGPVPDAGSRVEAADQVGDGQ